MADHVQYTEPIAVCETSGKVCGTEVNTIENNDDENSISNKCDKHPPEDSCSKSGHTTEESCNAQKVETNSLLGSYITKEYELLHLVLSHLPIGDLHAASQVCKTWNSAAASVRRNRINPHWLMWRITERPKTPAEPHGTKSYTYSEYMASVPYLAFHEHVYSEPVLALMFVSHHVYNYNIRCSYKNSCPSSTPEKGEHAHTVWEYLRAELRPCCPLYCLRGYGIVGTYPDLSETLEVENSRAYSVLLLPEMPGVTIRTFELELAEVRKLDQTDPLCLSTGYVEHITGIPPEENIQCLLLFCREASLYVDAIMNLVTALQMRQDKLFAVGGGMISDVGGPIFDTYIVGVAISGAGVSVASTVLDGSVKTERAVDRSMQELKEHSTSNCNSSVGFMFACVGRGKHYYHGKRNVESKAFRRYFPKTPLFGYFGNGEIGFKLLPDLIENKRLKDGPTRGNKRMCPAMPPILHSYTTIFVHLAFTGTNNSNHNQR